MMEFLAQQDITLTVGTGVVGVVCGLVGGIMLKGKSSDKEFMKKEDHEDLCQARQAGIRQELQHMNNSLVRIEGKVEELRKK